MGLDNLRKMGFHEIIAKDDAGGNPLRDPLGRDSFLMVTDELRDFRKGAVPCC